MNMLKMNAVRRLTVLTGVVLCAAPALAWQVKTYQAGDEVSVVEKDGVTTVAFSIEPKTPRISGCHRFTGGWADLLFERPRPLSSEDEHILLESSLPVKVDRTTVELLPLVRDEDGELFCFKTQETPALRPPKRAWEFSGGWRALYTPSFYAGEAGAAAQDVFTLESEGVDFTPGKKLVFLGFRLLLGQSVKDVPEGEGNRRRAGTLHFAAVRTCGAKLPVTDAYAYADAVLPRKGTFRLAAQVRNAFQGVPVHEFSRVYRYDPEDPASRRQRVSFPAGPDGCYWIDWQVTDEGGAVVNGGSFRNDVVGSPATAAPQPVDVAQAPVLGVMRVNAGHAGRGVYGADETAVIDVAVFGGAAKTITWQTLPLAFANVLETGEASVPPGEGAHVAITPKREAGRSAYRLVLEAKDAAGRLLDKQTYFYGWRNAEYGANGRVVRPLAAHDRAGRTPNRRDYKKHPYNRTTFTPMAGGKKGAHEDAYLQEYRRFLEESCELATSFTFMLDLRDWEVLPGVFDTWLLDRVFDAAADAGMKATVRACHCDMYDANLYRWNTYMRQVGADGTVLPGHRHYGAYSVPDPVNTKVWLDAYRALFDRYRGHTAFEGYYIMQPGGEWTVIDQPWNGTVSGYDPATRADFIRWQKKKYGADYEAAEPPLPTFRDGMKPDFRRAWIDFCRYKTELHSQWMLTSLNAIRAYDDDRLTISYCRPRTMAQLLGDKLDYGHNGGNHYGKNLYEYIDAWKTHRVGWISEPHHPHAWCAYGDPGERGWVLDWTTWVMTAQAAGGGANIHIYYHPWKTLSRTDFWGGRQGFDRFEAFKPILNELHGMDVIRPPSRVAFGSDNMTLWTKHRTTFSARLADLRLYSELLEQDVVSYEDFLPERMDEYKLVLPNLLDEALEAETFRNYVKAVRERGVKMILTANTGSYVPELFGSEPFQLLKALGIRPPQSAWCRKGTNVRATCVGNSALFEAGRVIPFETGDRLHAQLLDEEVQRRFWNFRFRWLPETDYFGYYPGVEVGADAKVLARFADGGTAISQHAVGKGEVVVFWGLPDFDGDNLKGLMAAAAKWAGVENPLADCPVARFIEGENKRLKRHYLLLWQETPGTYVLKAPHLPDGTWFADDMVSGQRIGLFDGKTVREQGLSLAWTEGYSPLKYVRFSDRKTWFGRITADWSTKYRNEAK